MSVGAKLKRARKLQKPTVYQAGAAAIAGLSVENYAAAEKDRSEKSQIQAVAALSRAWNIAEDWFWDRLDTFPDGRLGGKLSITNETRAMYDSNKYVDIPLHKSISGKVISLHDSHERRVPVGLATGIEFAIRVSDLDNAPRFLPGNEIVFRPRELFDVPHNSWVAIEHRTEKVEFEGKRYSRIYVRRVTYEADGALFRALDSSAPSFRLDEVKPLGLAICRRIELAADWIVWEIREEGLPFDAPRM